MADTSIIFEKGLGSKDRTAALRDEFAETFANTHGNSAFGKGLRALLTRAEARLEARLARKAARKAAAAEDAGEQAGEQDEEPAAPAEDESCEGCEDCTIGADDALPTDDRTGFADRMRAQVAAQEPEVAARRARIADDNAAARR